MNKIKQLGLFGLLFYSIQVQSGSVDAVKNNGWLCLISVLLLISIALLWRARAKALAYQKTLEQEHRRMSEVIEGTRVGVWEWNIQTGDILLNNRWADMLGYTLAEIEPVSIEKWQTHIHPDDLPKMKSLLAHHFDGHAPYYHCEYRLRHKSGHWVWLQSRGRVSSWTARRQPLLMSGTHQDISERKQADEILAKSEHLLNQAQEIAHLGSWELDLIHPKLYWSAEVYRIFEIDPQTSSPSYQSFMDCIHPDDRELVDHAYHYSLVNKSLYNIEHRLLMADGRVKYVNERCETEYKQDKPLRSTGIVLDISAHKQAELAVRESEARYRTIVNSIAEIGEGLFIVDEHHHILYMNKIMVDWFGEQTGQLCYCTIAASKQACGHCQLDAVIHQNKTVHYQATYSNDRHYEIVATPIKNNNGSYAKMEVIRDITERKQAELELKQRVQELTDARKASLNMMADLDMARLEAERANRVKSEFLAHMSHEIRTPLNAVTGMVYLLQQTPLNSKQSDYLHTIHRSMLHVNGIIGDLLDFSKLEARKLELENLPFDLDQVFDIVSDFVMQDAQNKGLEVLFSVPLDVPRALVGDPTRLGQILTNLANNAVKFCERGEILISVKVEQMAQQTVTLGFNVKDTGIGMDEAQVARLFEAFEQADSSITRRYGGTGLGLTVCQFLVQAMHGQISVTTRPHQGSEFHFTVVLGLQPFDKEKLFVVPADLQGLRVLVVDDNETSRRVLSEILASLNFYYVAVDSGKKALQVLQQAHQDDQPFDLILIDWLMPEMDGIETADRIRNHLNLQNPPLIIMVSAYQKAHNATKPRVDIQAYLHKPVNASFLFDTVMAVFGKNLPKAHWRKNKTSLHIPHINGEGRKILLVEDQFTNRQIASEILTRNGFAVEAVENGALAVNVMAKQPRAFAAILMDLQMPVMDGYQATRQIRQLPDGQDIPIIAMTAHALKEEREKCQAAGMNAHVAKPIDVNLLLNELSHWLNIPLPSEHSTDGAVAVLPAQVDGIALADGLARVMGNHALYQKLLQRFPQHYQLLLNAVKQAIEDNDFVRAAQDMHTLAGSAGNLAMMPLCQQAKALQQLLENHASPARCKAQWRVVEQHFTQVVEAINRLPIQTETTTVANEPKENLSVDTELHTLVNLLHNNDLHARKLMQHLFNHMPSPLQRRLQPIAEAVEQLNYPQALNLLKQFMEQQDSSCHTH